VTRCTCGTLHVTLHANGVTLRMSADALRNASAGLKAAIENIDDAATSTDATIN
jgi:hypothetical protein